MAEVQFNSQQQQAINHINGPLLVLAGAGSGKTYVVTYRIAKLLELGISPKDILAVTFTNKAAQEMQQRINHLTKEHILSCTFHSLGARILRECISELSFTNDFTIYDSEDSLRVIKNCLESLHIKDEKGLSKKIKEKISSYKNDLLSEEDINPSFFSDEIDRISNKVYPLYQKKLHEYNALDFDDLLYLTVKLLIENKSVREIYQNRWLYVLIDEYQDTNHAQYLLSKILVEKHKNICVVGDPDQSIYSWRGAKYQNILHFDKDFHDATIINLEHNYRSTNTILEASNALIANNPNRYEKNLWSTFGTGEKIGLFFAENEKLEATFVVNTIIEKYKYEQIPLENIVIFYRTNAQSRIFEDALLQMRIPYIIYGGLSFYQRKEIKDILAFLKCIHSNSDFISFERIINIPKRGIGKASIQKLHKIAEKHFLSIFDLCHDLLENPLKFPEIKLSSKQKLSLQEFLSFINQIRKIAMSQVSLQEIITETIHLSGYLDYLKEDPETFDNRKENIDELIAKAAEMQEMRPSLDLSIFLEELSLLSHMEKEKNPKSIKLMTLHNGKGLEFPIVFIVGLEEEIFPHANAKNKTIEDIEEERRLFYVGMTRAKKELFLSSSGYRFMWGMQRLMRPSRFIKEIPNKFIKLLSPANKTYTQENIVEKELEKSAFSIGSRVYHNTFGVGIIRKAYETSLGKTYDILFEDGDTMRSLVAKYAKLKAIY